VAAGITLVVLGAILAFAVRADAPALDVQVVGLIFMLAGAAIIAHFRRERHLRQTVTHVEHRDPESGPPETAHHTITHETVYEGDESAPVAPPPPPPSAPQRAVHGYDHHH
jgi:hypothetical protein